MKRELSRKSHAPRTGISRREFLHLLAVGGTAALLAACSQEPQLTPPETATVPPASPAGTTAAPTASPLGTTAPKAPVSYAKLPRWRGFNLLEKFTLDGNAPYQESDLDFMSEWGFDFIRLPCDYRIWTMSPGNYREDPLKDIDRVIAWAQARAIHVNLNLHRAPGYCVNPPAEPLDLWTEDEARQQFAAQWGMLAARYRDIPATDLSFDLINEPPDIPAEQYLAAATAAVNAIRAESPERLVIADGLSWGQQFVPELAPLKIAQSSRGYEPFQVTHYRAEWVDGSDRWPVPTWPIGASMNAYLYGEYKPDYQSPLLINGDFPAGTRLSIRVDTVSDSAHLVVHAGDSIIIDHTFQPGPGAGEWKESKYRSEWNDYEAVYDREYSGTIPTGTSQLRIELTGGDWLTFSEISIDPFPGAAGNRLSLRPGDMEWARRQPDSFTLKPDGSLVAEDAEIIYSRETLWNDRVGPWKEASEKYGIGVHIGEWGVYNYTPHDVTLAFMQDCLANWKQAGFGWALWNLRGGFGVLDSDRADVEYEDFHGHKLDRKMLEVLQQG
jgi:aryl-phospho-beta-D-glucosidase BglC (GH1 family)